ncbi:Uncharacterized protein APZ42_031843 [Daphnia magna]|uniref:Uncharacterized protein n=1 Tax=Daphnia magna TaxID=35525 RepID=A0A162DAN5_9CRUS|nr:Uncharacterized protein APZ42_031843 [Daphnia magna]
MDCNTPLSTEAVLRKNDPLIFHVRKKTCTKQRTIKFLLTSASLTAPILDKLNSRTDHLPLSLEAAICVYVTGYCIFKYGQHDVFCSDCYNKSVTLSSNACYLRLIKHLGSGWVQTSAWNFMTAIKVSIVFSSPIAMLTDLHSYRHQLFGISGNDLLHSLGQFIIFRFSDNVQELQCYGSNM